MSDTICAISTAAGNGAIAVIRLSGESSFLIAAAKLKYDVLDILPKCIPGFKTELCHTGVHPVSCLHKT